MADQGTQKKGADVAGQQSTLLGPTMRVGMLEVKIRNLGEHLIFLSHDFSQRELLDTSRFSLNPDTMMIQFFRNLFPILICRPCLADQDFKGVFMSRHIGGDIEGVLQNR